MSKEQRRKKREEKFYQALYQNKDSHIQFVTADLIRQLQSPGYQSPSPKSLNVPPPRSRHLQGRQQAETVNTASISHSHLCSELDFPSLTPTSTTTNVQVEEAFSIGVSISNEDVKSTTEEVSGSNETKQAAPLQQAASSSSSLLSVPAPVVKTKKSKQPMLIDISALIVDKKKEVVERRSFVNVTGKGPCKDNHKLTTGNLLDSSGPGVIHRGKIREKKKKPNKLKLTILKSRALKKNFFEERNKQELDSTITSIAVKPVCIGEVDVKDGDRNAQSPSPASKDDNGTITSNDDVECVSVSTSLVEAEPSSVRDSEYFAQDEIGSKVESQTISTSFVHCLSDTVPVSENRNNNDPIIERKSMNDVKPESDFGGGEIMGSEGDISTKFLKLLDEISVMKIEQAVSPDVEIAVKNEMHSRKFRDYCDMYTSKELQRHVVHLMAQLYRFQDKLYHNDPIKFKTKRRFIIGLKEALSYLSLNKVQLLIIAPDIEKVPEPGGLDEKINQILSVSKGRNVPYVFSGTKYNLGKPMRIKTPVSIIAILDSQSCEETFRAILDEANQLREKYQNDFLERVEKLTNNASFKSPLNKS